MRDGDAHVYLEMQELIPCKLYIGTFDTAIESLSINRQLYFQLDILGEDRFNFKVVKDEETFIELKNIGPEISETATDSLTDEQLMLVRYFYPSVCIVAQDMANDYRNSGTIKRLENWYRRTFRDELASQPGEINLVEMSNAELYTFCQICA